MATIKYPFAVTLMNNSYPYGNVLGVWRKGLQSLWIFTAMGRMFWNIKKYEGINDINILEVNCEELSFQKESGMSVTKKIDP